VSYENLLHSAVLFVIDVRKLWPTPMVELVSCSSLTTSCERHGCIRPGLAWLCTM